MVQYHLRIAKVQPARPHVACAGKIDLNVFVESSYNRVCTCWSTWPVVCYIHCSRKVHGRLQDVCSFFRKSVSQKRFSAVLTLYLLNVLKFNEQLSTVFFNGFTVVCYFTPIIGAIVADGFIGMFWLAIV